MNKPHLQLLQALRAVASLLVVLLHCTVNVSTITHSHFCGGFFRFGGSGVDLFFVLSGFIITYTTSNRGGARDILPFIKRRAVRIYPTYWLLASLFLGSQLAFPRFYHSHFPMQIVPLVSTYLLFPDHIMLNGVSWTLTHELFFYLLFAISFLVPTSWSLLATALYTVALIALRHMDSPTASTWTHLSLFGMNVEFVLGVMIALATQRWVPSRRTSIVLVVLGSAAFLVAGAVSNSNPNLLAATFGRVLLFGVPGAVVILGLVWYELVAPVALHGVVLSLGDASYSLYLIHLPVLAATIRLLPKCGVRAGVALHLSLFLLIAALCIASIHFYRCVERPVISWLSRSIIRSSSRPSHTSAGSYP